MREVHIAIKQISASEKDDIAIRAALAGVKLPSNFASRGDTDSNSDFDEKEQRAAERAILAAQERVKRRTRK